MIEVVIEIWAHSIKIILRGGEQYIYKIVLWFYYCILFPSLAL